MLEDMNIDWGRILHKSSLSPLCFFIFGAFVFGICWLVKCHGKKKMVQKREDIDIDEHRKVQEMVVPGPHGLRRVVLSMEDDVHVHDKVSKNEVDMVGKGLHGESKQGTARALEGGVGPIGGSSQQLCHPEHLV